MSLTKLIEEKELRREIYASIEAHTRLSGNSSHDHEGINLAIDEIMEILTSSLTEAYNLRDKEIREILKKGGVSSDCIYQNEIDDLLTQLNK